MIKSKLYVTLNKKRFKLKEVYDLNDIYLINKTDKKVDYIDNSKL